MTHTPEALSPSSISSSPKYDLIPSPVYSGWERKKKLKWKNRVLKMMYCGNCAESTYESKNKSRQIVCKGVNELKNALKALKRLGSWNMAMKSAEKEGQRFSKKSKILAKQREQGSTADARGTLFIKAPRSKGVNAYRAWKCGYAFWTLQEKAKSLKCWDLLTSLTYCTSLCTLCVSSGSDKLYLEDNTVSNQSHSSWPTYWKPWLCSSRGMMVGRNSSMLLMAFCMTTSNTHSRGRHSSSISLVDDAGKYLRKIIKRYAETQI